MKFKTARIHFLDDVSAAVAVAVVVAYATGRQEEEDGKTAVCDKRDRAITCGFCRDLHLTPRFSGPLQKDLFKGKKGKFGEKLCQIKLLSHL